MSTFDLPEPWAEDLRPAIATKVAQSMTTLVVLDDDPTGTQTVHNVAVYTHWSVAVLTQAFAAQDAIFYILTNSRSLAEAEARSLALEIGANLNVAAASAGQAFKVVSRSDSTLRGHYPAEVEALAQGLGQSIDAHIIIPAFFEAGRETINDVHYIHQGENYTPVNQTAFAQDAVFAYQHANLKQWVAEKTRQAIAETEVLSLSLDDLRLAGPAGVTQKLLASAHKAIIVNATCYRDLDVFTLGLLAAEASGKRYLYRTAASFVVSRAGLQPRALLTPAELDLSASTGGLIMVGSHVPLSSMQLDHLQRHTEVSSLELEVAKLLNSTDSQAICKQISDQANQLLNQGQDVVIYTSRQLITSQESQRHVDIAARVSHSLVEILKEITVRPRYIMAKGGITSSDLATRGLGVHRATVKGQILAGVPLWVLGPEARFPALDFIVFPGNVGAEDALTKAFRLLQ
jgi:uncharacterized protein YgbK (DUF1537 family)